MLNRSASLAMSASILKALPGKLDIKRHSPSILYVPHSYTIFILLNCSIPVISMCFQADEKQCASWSDHFSQASWSGTIRMSNSFDPNIKPNILMDLIWIKKFSKSLLADTKMVKLMALNLLGQNFFISWFTNPPTVIFRKVEKK